jgi:hypothetical protein
LNGSSFDTTTARSYLGGASDANARATVSRANPNDFATCRCDRRSTSTNRRISAHCSTPTTHSSSPDPQDQTSVKAEPDTTAPAPAWPSFQPAQVAQYSTGAHIGVVRSRTPRVRDPHGFVHRCSAGGAIVRRGVDGAHSQR